MNKFLKWFLITVLSLGVIGFVGYKILMNQTKKHSPLAEEVLAVNDVEMSVSYCQPAKKGRVIFGELVPYGKTWRTGANEASTFSVNHDIYFGDQAVKAGTYTLWTVPNKESWEIILNDKMYGWGVNFDESAAREPQFDVANYTVPVQQLNSVEERFTIKLKESMKSYSMAMMWDDVKVVVPITLKTGEDLQGS